MKEGMELAKAEKVGNVYRCSCGAIHVNMRGFSLHLTEEGFFCFAAMIERASSLLMDKVISDITG